MSLLIDTSVLIDIEKRRKETLTRLLELKKIHPAKPRLSFISYFEFLFGLRNRSPRNKEKAQSYLDKFEIVHTNDSCVKNLVYLKEKYELPLADLIIASQVMEKGDVLITKDKDFEQIKEIEKIIILN